MGYAATLPPKGLERLRTAGHAKIADTFWLCHLSIMASRLTGIVATLWFFFALLSLFIALVFSPMGLRLLLPGNHPVTWFYPVLLVLPPVVLGLGKAIGTRLSPLLLWPLAVSLGLVALLLFGFLAATFVGH